jgi:haloacetate dehalogenase
MTDFMHDMRRETIRANGLRFNVWHAGTGPAVVLLHGYPQTGQMWRKIAPQLVREFSVVVPDLRGYGDSDKPRDGYDKRTMARDVALVMESLGHRKYHVVGHDRGARVAHRLALDHAAAVIRLAVLDIVPTHTVFRDAGKDLAAAYWHWFFFQVPDLPEIMITQSAEPFLRHVLRALTYRAGAIDEAMFQEYLRAFRLPGTIRGSLEDYRAAATIDLLDDERDLESKLACPVLAVWGEYGKMHTLFDVVSAWREKADDVRGGTLPCGHFIPEEAPDELLAVLLPFLRGEGS